MLRSSARRRMLPVVALVTVALSLTGCGSSAKKKDTDLASKPARDSGCGYKAGGISDAVKVTGDFGTNVTVSFPKTAKATTLQRTVITKGSGAAVAKGDVADVGVTLYNGTTGKLINQLSTKFTSGDAAIGKDLLATIDCTNFGSRVAAAFPAKDLLGDQANTAAGVSPTDTLIAVADILDKYADPKPQEWTGAPKVTFNGSKSPKVTLPSGDPSSDLLLHVIKAGNGAKVRSGDSVTVNYKGITWGTNQVFDESYGKGKKPATFPTDQVVPGFGAALVGQKVGTRLIVSIPPKYGYGTLGTNALAGKTLVFVIEIKSTKSAK
ncbi:MAG: FKBP-type peptidyl-prolyl cis-trans isomerase [Marmoricola sp.]